MEDIHLNTSWENVINPICWDFPHNGVLPQCSIKKQKKKKKKKDKVDLTL